MKTSTIVAAGVVAAAVATVGSAFYFGVGALRGEHGSKTVLGSRGEASSKSHAQDGDSAETFEKQFQRAVLSQAAAAPPQHEEEAEKDAAGEDEEPASPEPALSEAQKNEERARERRAQQASLEQFFRQQGPGGAWARDTAMAINNTLVGLVKPPNAVLKSVDCRETVCRIEVGTNDEDHYDEAFQSLLHSRWSFGTGPFFVGRNDADGTTKGVVMFLSRNDAALPGVASPPSVASP